MVDNRVTILLTIFLFSMILVFWNIKTVNQMDGSLLQNSVRFVIDKQMDTLQKFSQFVVNGFEKAQLGEDYLTIFLVFMNFLGLGAFIYQFIDGQNGAIVLIVLFVALMIASNFFYTPIQYVQNSIMDTNTTITEQINNSVEQPIQEQNIIEVG